MWVWVTWNDSLAGRERTAEITANVTRRIKDAFPAGVIQQVWVTVNEQPNSVFCDQTYMVGDQSAEATIEHALWSPLERNGNADSTASA